ncbi:hypothetical protein C8F04DRAFT_1237562 [Mycena alexandri]|uniref:Uncharacterized protein n=1 Tax=Mycena alexandri TaxID=1745969 RepID=A0AAD6SI41_9AGAR|nr:hypothetical protein C8F04DRAFT_1237562 [Mycena alexandri]
MRPPHQAQKRTLPLRLRLSRGWCRRNNTRCVNASSHARCAAGECTRSRSSSFLRCASARNADAPLAPPPARGRAARAPRQRSGGGVALLHLVARRTGDGWMRRRGRGGVVGNQSEWALLWVLLERRLVGTVPGAGTQELVPACLRWAIFKRSPPEGGDTGEIYRHMASSRVEEEHLFEVPRSSGQAVAFDLRHAITIWSSLPRTSGLEAFSAILYWRIRQKYHKRLENGSRYGR